MYNIALDIKSKDWMHILLIGIVFGALLSTLGYGLFSLSLLDGAIFGLLLGFSITLFSLIFISTMNKKILPNIDEIYWVPLSVLFSFLSGFLGTYLGVFLAQKTSIQTIDVFVENIVYISIALGVLTYIVGALLYRFVKMRNHKEMVDNQYMQSRLRSLETQLNPHFLFNALNSIAELIHQDPAKAELAILKVSSFLRNTMNESALIELNDEIKNILDYVELENIRYNQKIKLHIQGDVPFWYIPKFSLQLLVENAIKHGFENVGNDLNIWILFDKEDKMIVVKNDGKRMESSSFGIGLNNLKQRLELLCKGSIEVDNSRHVTFYIKLGECCEDTDRRR
jgi:sensor histidine kinase YesM